MPEIALSQTHIRHGSNIGQPLTRRDGVLKVTGAAKYAADRHPPGMLYAVLATSTIARGRVASLDVAAAKAHPGVIEVEHEVFATPGIRGQEAGEERIAVEQPRPVRRKPPAGVLQGSVRVHDLGPGQPDAGVRFDEPDEGREDAGVCHRIGIEESQEAAPGLRQTAVDPAGEPNIRGVFEHAEVGPGAAQLVGQAVARGVVHHDDLVLEAGTRSRQRCQTGVDGAPGAFELVDSRWDEYLKGYDAR